MKKFNIKWTNMYSDETGYVAKLSLVNKCFINTYEKEEAKKYVSERAAHNEIARLTAFGEAENNIFEVEEA